MLAVVKMPHTKNQFEVRGDIPESVLKFLRKRYGAGVTVVDDDEELVDIRDTKWYQTHQSQATPGTSLRTYRRRDKLSQAELGKLLGGLSVQKISDMEHGRRGISKEMTKKLAAVFGTRADRFL